MDILEMLASLMPEKDMQARESAIAPDTDAYHAEPIPHNAVRERETIPPRIRQLRVMQKQGASGLDAQEHAFYQQARFMEDYVDDYPIPASFSRSYPYYSSLHLSQLRGYFSWRARVRQGELPPAPTPFAFLYCYELIHLIGVQDADAGYHALQAFFQQYAASLPEFQKLVPEWLDDMVIYYQLPAQLLSEASNPPNEAHILTLLQGDAVPIEERFYAMMALSKYHIAKSRYYKAHPQRVMEAACIALAYLLQTVPDPVSYLFESRVKRPYYPFVLANFYNWRQVRNATYVVNAIRQYVCVNGRWYQECYRDTHKPSYVLSQLLHALDVRLRERTNDPYPLKAVALPPTMATIVEQTIDDVLAAECERQRPQVTLDFSKLQAIREAAEQTRDKLVLPEAEGGLYDGDAPMSPISPASESIPSASSATVQDAVPLSPQAGDLLDCLLAGRSYAHLTTRAGVLLSVLVDEINEAYYDIVGDTVLEMDEDKPTLMEDYREMLEASRKG